MSVQTTITLDPAIGSPGCIYDSGVFHDIITCIATTAIPFGAAVKVSGEYCAVPAASTDVTAGKLGIAVEDPNKPGPYGTNVGGYQIGDLVNVMISGRIWVATETAVANQSNPFVRYAAGAGGPQGGAFRADIDSTTAIQKAEPSGMHFVRGNSAAGLAILEINHTGG